MGLVFIARREKDQKLYALKTLKEWDKKKEELIKDAILFFREALVWIILGKHRNIVQAFWFDLDNNYHPFLIMEYVKGQRYGVSLRHYLRSSGRLDTALGVRFVLEALNGLVYAKTLINKELGIPFIHKDIKPENLLVTRDGILKVTDFGLVMGRGGTPLYKAPEQWEEKEVEEKTDVYALGCVLYELMGRYPPFLGKFLELKNKHLYEKPASLIKCPSDLNELIMLCLSKSPDARPDFLELRNGLQNVYKRLTGEYLPLKGESEVLSPEDLNARGSGFDQLRYHEKAIECYTNAIALDPNDQRFYLNRANAKLSMNLRNSEEVIEDYNKALSLDAESIEAHLGLGNLFAHKGDYGEALRYYEEVKNLSPSEPMACVCMGNVYAQQGLYEKGVSQFKKALSIHPNSAEAYLGLGNLYLCQRDYPQAEESYKKAIDLNPLYANAYLNLARLYQLMGKFEERDVTIEIVLYLMPLKEDDRRNI